VRMDWWLALIVKPFAAVAFFVVAWLVARLLHRIIPDGKIKRHLYSPLPWLRKRDSRD
jgi:hypothetical protein